MIATLQTVRSTVPLPQVVVLRVCDIIIQALMAQSIKCSGLRCLELPVSRLKQRGGLLKSKRQLLAQRRKECAKVFQ